MAKQTYTTGQVLTAAEMTTLQTNDFNQTVSAKTASYTLVAADAGTRITMSNASATTVTVNTAIFAAGDTLEITNIGAGICTVTAGSATVSTSSTLALKQFDTGQLYFTSTGVAIFFMADAADAGGSPLTTKGDLYTFSTLDARLAVGTNGQVLTADSSEATGLKYATPASGGMTLISTTTLSGASVTLSSIPQTFVHLQYIIVNMLPATDGSNLSLAINGDTTGSRYFNKSDGGNNATGSYNSGIAQITYDMDNAVTQGLIWGQIPYYTNATTWKFFQTQSLTNDNTTSTNYRWSFYANGYNQTDAISSLKFQPNSGNFTSGTLYLYGVK